MKHDERLQRFLARSREVLNDCALENGAVVAANTDKQYTPRAASDYRSVWPRDAVFVCVAAKLLGQPEVSERFLLWVDEKPEGFRKEKLLYQKYSTNGRKQGWQFQADQMGTILWLVNWFYEGKREQAERFFPLVERLADGLMGVWNGRFFTQHVTDLWEQEHLHTTWTNENNFTYTLAACSQGLLAAHALLPNKEWQAAAVQMIDRINQAWSEKDGYFLRNHGNINDPNVDASLLGLVWPFAILPPSDPRILKTIAAIEQHLVINGGVHRFQFDYYDGEGSAQEGGGAWPVLNFWMSIYWSLAGDRKKALTYFQWVLGKVDAQSEKYRGYLPEQLFDDERIGIYPLAWSHAMFVIAGHHLKLLP